MNNLNARREKRKKPAGQETAGFGTFRMRDLSLCLKCGPVFTEHGFQETIMKLHSIPAQMAEPITPEELQAIACISKKLLGSS